MLELNVTKNTNTAIQGTAGKYYARVEYKGTYGVKQLARYIAKHSSTYTAGEISGMLTDLVTAIKELALLGYVVKIDDLGLFKASVDANGLTLEKGAKITAGRGAQRTDEELTADISVQQFAVGAVKLIMQATGETTIENMNRDSTLAFTSKTKAMIKKLTGDESTDEDSGSNGGGSVDDNNDNNDNNGGSQNGGGSNNDNGGNTGGDNGGGDNGGDNGGGGGQDAGGADVN